MSLRPRWQRRAAGLWAGLLAAGSAVGVVEYLRFSERFVPLVMVTGAIALLIGGVGTWRMHAQDQEPFISVRDLRRR